MNDIIKIPVDIKQTEEATGTVWLTDGTRFLLRTIVTHVVKHVGKFDADGNQIYEVFHQTQVITKPPRN